MQHNVQINEELFDLPEKYDGILLITFHGISHMFSCEQRMFCIWQSHDIASIATFVVIWNVVAY